MTKRIVLIQPFSLETRIRWFIGIFGGLWLFMEPLSAFGLAVDFLKSSGYGGYVTLILLASVITIIIEYLNKKRIKGRQVFIPLVILQTSSGSEHLVEVPRSMQISQFLELFVKHFSIERVMWIKQLLSVDHYDLTLQVKRNGQYQTVSNRNTINEAGILSGDECIIRGTIKRKYHNISLNTIGGTGGRAEVVEVEIPYKVVQILSLTDSSKN